jgi:hypothetical protein
MAADQITTPCEIIPAINQHANLIDDSVVSATIPSNGILRLTKNDNTIVDVNIPYFLDGIVSGLNFSLDVSPNANRILYTSGTYQINAVVYNIANAGNIILSPGDINDPRIDIISLSPTNTVVYTVGVPSPNPVAPAIPTGHLKVLEISASPNADQTGGYTITAVNVLNNNNNNVNTPVQPGTFKGDTLFWNNIAWEPTGEVFYTQSGNGTSAGYQMIFGSHTVNNLNYVGPDTAEGATSIIQTVADTSNNFNYYKRVGIEDSFTPAQAGITETLLLDTTNYSRSISKFLNEITDDCVISSTNVLARIQKKCEDFADTASIVLEVSDFNTSNFNNSLILDEKGLKLATPVHVKTKDVTNFTASFISLDQDEYLLIINATNIPVLVLPEDPQDGRVIIIKKSDGGNLDINAHNTETINLVASPYILTGNKTSIKLIYVATLNDWMII